MIIGVACPLERDACERCPRRREGRRQYRIALDDAGIAEGGLLACACALNQRHCHAALGEMQRDACADDAGAQNDRVGACHLSCSPLCRLGLYMEWLAPPRYDRSATAGHPFRCRLLRGFADWTG